MEGLAAEVYASAAVATGNNKGQQLGGAAQAWRAVLGWFDLLFRVLLQIVRGTSSWVQVLSFVGIADSFSSSSSFSLPFRPLPADDEVPAEVKPPAEPPKGGDPLSKLTVVLDLDETLVCAYETSSLPAIIRNQAIEAGLHCFDIECISTEKEADGKHKINHVTVFERPGLHEFLRQINEFADLVLFTAGLEGYARPLIDRIDIENRFTRRLYRPSTVSTEYRENVKDLSCLSNDLSRIILVDNNPFSFLLQPSNGIPCVPFSVGQPYDDQLIRVLLPLIKQLSVQKDVRPLLYERFHMPEWFQKHGVPSSEGTV